MFTVPNSYTSEKIIFFHRNWWHTPMTWLYVALLRLPSQRVAVSCLLAMMISTAMSGTLSKGIEWAFSLGMTIESAVSGWQKMALPLQQAPGIHSSKSGIREPSSFPPFFLSLFSVRGYISYCPVPIIGMFTFSLVTRYLFYYSLCVKATYLYTANYFSLSFKWLLTVEVDTFKNIHFIVVWCVLQVVYCDRNFFIFDDMCARARYMNFWPLLLWKRLALGCVYKRWLRVKWSWMHFPTLIGYDEPGVREAVCN